MVDPLGAKKSVEINGDNISYSEAGSGETIIFIHGITTYSFIWQNIIPQFSNDYHTISIDLLGCGDSDKPLNEDYSLTSHAERLFEFVKALNISKFHLVGHDLGGGVTQIFSVNHPEYLYDLTVINSVAYDFWPVQPIIAMRTPVIRQLAMATLDLGVFKLIVQRGLFNKDRVTDDLMKHFWKPMLTLEGRKAFLHFAECLDNKNLIDISDKLHKTEIPMLIIRGENDVYLSSEIARKLHSNIPTSKLVLIPNAGHFIQVDEPELVSNTILEFYRKTQ
ncbi:MAG: alpha/beta hydrolase [Melioribacteraceae bacterium]